VLFRSGGRGSGCALKKGGGHTIALRTIALSASCNAVRFIVGPVLANGYQMVNSVGFQPTIVASVIISFKHLLPNSLIIGCVVSLVTQCQPLVSR